MALGVVTYDELKQIYAMTARINEVLKELFGIDALVDTRSEFIRTCIYGVVLAAVICWICAQGSTPPTAGQMLSYAVMCFFVPFGWKILTYLQSFMPLTIIGTVWFWVLWVMIKAVVSMVIGVPAFIYQLFKTFFAQGKIQKTRQEIQAEQIQENQC